MRNFSQFVSLLLQAAPLRPLSEVVSVSTLSPIMLGFWRHLVAVFCSTPLRAGVKGQITRPLPFK